MCLYLLYDLGCVNFVLLFLNIILIQFNGITVSLSLYHIKNIVHIGVSFVLSCDYVVALTYLCATIDRSCWRYSDGLCLSVICQSLLPTYLPLFTFIKYFLNRSCVLIFTASLWRHGDVAGHLCSIHSRRMLVSNLLHCIWIIWVTVIAGKSFENVYS